MLYDVIFRTARGSSWRILGAPMTRERAFEVATQGRKHAPVWDWNIKLTWAKFPGVA